MNEILTVGAYTLRRYMRNPITVVIFLVAPFLQFAFLADSKITSFTVTNVSVPIGSVLINNFIVPLGGLKTTDRECFIFLLMDLFYFAVASCQSVAGDLKTGLAARFKASPVTPFKNILGKMLGNFVLLFCFSLVSMLMGKYIFSVNFGANLALTIAVLLLFDIIVVGIGVLLSVIIRNIYVCCLTVFCLDFLMMFPAMYKIFTPLKITPVFSFLLKVSIHDHALTAVSNANVSGLTLLIIIAAVVTPLSLLVGRSVLK